MLICSEKVVVKYKKKEEIWLFWEESISFLKLTSALKNNETFKSWFRKEEKQAKINNQQIVNYSKNNLKQKK